MRDPEEGELAQQSKRYETFVGYLSRYEVAIRSYVWTLMPGGEGVDDVCQETALECWRKFSEYENRGNSREFIRWACVIAHFKVLSFRRDQSRDRLVFRESVLELVASKALDHSSQLYVEQSVLEKCLGKLDSENKRLLMSAYNPGQSIAEIARETGEHSQRLYRRVRHLRGKLMDCVKSELAEEGRDVETA